MDKKMADFEENLDIPLTDISWNPAWRIIASRFPTVQLFERVTEKEDLEAVFFIESLTNDRLRAEKGIISVIPEEEKVFGPGSHYIMAPFTHLSPTGSRFSDGSYGVFYTAYELETAISETVYHRENFLRATHQPPIQCEMRVLICKVQGILHDIRDFVESWPNLYHPYFYGESQSVGLRLKQQSSKGIIYYSVRQQGGTNAAIFSPKMIENCRQERHLAYCWNGQKIDHVYEMREIKRT